MRAALRTSILLLLAALPAAGLVAQSKHNAQIDEATALADAGKFDEAIAKLQAVLKEDPADTEARYELALTFGSKGDTKQCRETMAPVGAVAGPLQVRALTAIANCLDNENDWKAAIATYRKALAIDPNDVEVAFNLAIALSSHGSDAEALSLFKQHATADPRHASGHLALAKMFDSQHLSVPALFAYLHFIALEPSGERAAAAADRIRTLMDAGFQKTAKGANITVDPNASKAEGDYSAMAVALPMAAAARDLDEKAKLSQFEQIRLQLVSDVTMFTEMTDKQTDFTATMHVPFFRSMIAAKALDGFAAVVLVSQDLPGMADWAKLHEAEVVAFFEWQKTQAGKKGIPMPPQPAPQPAPAPTPAT